MRSCWSFKRISFMSKRSLAEALRAGEFVAAPGLHDMIPAVIANKVGFDFVYASGFWLTASGLGLPDAGIATYTQMLDRVATLTRLFCPRAGARAPHTHRG